MFDAAGEKRGGRLEWSNGQKVGFTVRLEPDGLSGRVLLYYEASRPDGTERTRERVTVDFAKVRGRWGFECPDCGRRCEVLYMPPGLRRWCCRVCGRLTYRSTQTEYSYKTKLERLWRRLSWDDLAETVLAGESEGTDPPAGAITEILRRGRGWGL
jgi:hypothetical protein